MEGQGVETEAQKGAGFAVLSNSGGSCSQKWDFPIEAVIMHEHAGCNWSNRLDSQAH
jgi:hypothetical protein